LLTWKARLWKIRLTQKVGLQRIRLTQKTGLCTTRGGGGRKLEEVRGAAPIMRPAPRWCPGGITKTQKCRLQKMRQRELAEKKEEEERDNCFNHLRPMSKSEQTWREKWLAKEENGSSGDSSIEEEVEVTLA
jgi:hypothetical protein